MSRACLVDRPFGTFKFQSCKVSVDPGNARHRLVCGVNVRSRRQVGCFLSLRRANV